MRRERGVTLTSLTIYVIVATILLGTLSFININFMSELGELTKRSKMTIEMMKFYSFFINDVKSADRVLEFSDNYIRLDNGVQYVIKYRANQDKEDNQEYDIYEVYRGDVLITDELSGVFFDYDAEEEFIKVRLYAEENEIVKSEEQYFKVGRGY